VHKGGVAIRIEHTTIAVPGFRFAGGRAELKKNGAPDVALAVADEAVSAAAVFTTNLVRAAPVEIAAERARRGVLRAILVNSGCANACTGPAGMAAALDTTAAVAKALGAPADEVLPASTGVIGLVLDAAKVMGQIPALVRSLGESPDPFAEAILTTDRGRKVVHARGEIAGRPFSVLGVAKGAGMFHPSMAALPPHATMLSFLFTDAFADGAALSPAIARAADATFNQATVDGDTSTNDTLVVLASGRAETERAPAGRCPLALEEAMTLVCEELARKMVADGEGAEHLIELHVSGLSSNDDAVRIAKAVATSPLVKTALYGQDPNWGRILGAAGRAGVPFDPARARIVVGGVPIVEAGLGKGEAAEAEAHQVMARPSYRIDLMLGDGPGRARYLTSDLGIGYVRCNADYRS
jgi:glutamate N-acetyltransferase/amino-acid N-acetyltransferase